MMRTVSSFLVVLAVGFLLACGGGSHPAPASPVFTSTPGTAASQDTSYTYAIAATDPGGGTVSFSLVTMPAGATLTGNTLTWSPTASESRVSNSFEVRAATSEGGTADQSWTVTPTGTVTVNWVNTNWTTSGPVQIPHPSVVAPSALVPQPDGSLLLISGTPVSPGVFTIGQVPGGFYWLVVGVHPGIAGTAFWTSSSAFDLGRDVAASLYGVLGSNEDTTFDLNLSGLDPSLPPGVVGFSPAPGAFVGLPIFLTPQPGSTTVSGSATISTRLDWTTVNTAFLVQYEQVSLGLMNNLVLGPQLTQSNLALTNGGTNTITGTLLPSPQSSLDLNIPGSKWSTVFASVGPGAATPRGSWLSIAPEPYVVGVNTSPNLITTGPFLVQPNPGNGVPFDFSTCPGLPFFVFGEQPAVVTDQDFGTLQYGDPFPSPWTRELAFCQEVTVPIPVGGMSLPFPLNYSETVVPSSTPLAPLAEPVKNPTIDGSSLFTTTSVNNTVVTLAWSAPTGTSPYGYTVYVLQVIPQNNGAAFVESGIYNTAKTSVTLPPLTAGNIYLFVIVTEVDGIANMETSPYRSQLPTAFAPVLSAPITISSGAASPQLRGDPKLWQRFLGAKGESHHITAH
jgi:hypothetical protein